jgi:hypothetical protein
VSRRDKMARGASALEHEHGDSVHFKFLPNRKRGELS